MRLIASLVTLAISVLLLAPGPAAAGEPGAQLQRQIDRVLVILEDRQRDAAVRRREVRAIVDETFDFPEAARRTLGRHWDAQTPENRARFVALFVDLIDRAYLRRWKAEVGAFFDGVDADATDAELLAIAPKHPVFVLAPA